MSGVKFQLTCSIKRDDTNCLVFFKQDGQRFDTEKTIKMKVQTPYKFVLTFKPPQTIKSASLKGEDLEMTGEESTSLHSRYSLKWVSTNIPVTKKNRRLNFTLIMEVQNMGVIQLPFQFKFYRAEDTTHSTWGRSLNYIDYDCVYKDGQSFIEITKELFR
ncbi:CB1 cannabinoid receptor-interacting protein 1 [Parasteatoda tepidariorum]|uniref:CB1 cannabinoid receptor-interacting protein 1 n=1 Tax=Parasteatoda tepidariorum TaxID=114398 RepID=UPI00077F9213|nr:CB1 cannabinoid receptor-interacting protein 1 [Parasteatoda tepidariorum]